VTPLQLPVDTFQLRFPSWLKHLVTPLTADSPGFQKMYIKNKFRICMTNETFATAFYSLSLPWNQNLGNCQEAQNLITPTSRVKTNADNFS